MAASPTSPSATSVPGWNTYRRLWVFIRPYSRPLTLVIAISLCATALTLIQPYFSKLLIDRALMPRDMRALVWIAGLMSLTSALGFVVNILASYRYVKISAAMLFDLRLALFQHLQTLSPRFYAGYRLGDLMSRLNNDAGEVQRVSADALLSVLSNIGFLVGAVAMMLWLNWRLFLVGVVLIPACVYSFVRYQRILTALTKRLRERSADLGSFFVDSIMGMRVVVSLNAKDHEAARFKERNDAFVKTMLDVQIASFMTGALPGTILTLATASVFLYGGWMIIDGSMTIGTLVAFMAYHTRLLSPVQNLLSLTSSLASARVSLGRLFELFDTPAEVVESPNARAARANSWRNPTRRREHPARSRRSPRRCLLRDPRRMFLRDSWAERRGQIDAGGFVGALSRSRSRPHSDRRRGSAERAACGTSPAGDAGGSIALSV